MNCFLVHLYYFIRENVLLNEYSLGQLLKPTLSKTPYSKSKHFFGSHRYNLNQIKCHLEKTLRVQCLAGPARS